jgi:Uncharacterised BCR, YnfA/UPF0060 family
MEWLLITGGLFVLAGLCEIGGGYLVWGWMREHKPAPEFLSAQESFARDHPWYSVHGLEGVSQFPTLEVPDEMARVIREFIR